MTGEKMLLSIQDLDADLIQEAEFKSFPCAKNFSQRRHKYILIAAVLAGILLLAGCAYVVLSEADWFRAYFTSRNKQDLSSGQSSFIEENTQELADRVTVDGYTLTVESAIADSRNAYLKLRLQGPPNAVLGADLYAHQPRPTADGTGYQRTFYRLDDPDGFSGMGTWQVMEDDNPRDNSVSILYSINQTNNSAQPFFEEGILYRLHITDLEAVYEGERPHEPLTDGGVWDFDIVFESINNDVMELITDPVPTAFETISIEVTSFQLQTMSAFVTYSGRNDERGVVCLFDSAVVLKDGTRVSFKPRMLSPKEETCEIHFVLSSPIVLNEVDYVELRDGNRIFAPADDS